MFITAYRLFDRSRGYALPLAMVFGLAAMIVVAGVLSAAQDGRDSSRVRQTSTASQIVSDSAIARILAELSTLENSELLVRNYDPINPDTGQTYLGKDGVLHSGDELTVPVDEWTTYDPSAYPCYQEEGRAAPSMSLTGTIGPGGAYRVLAYRYRPSQKEGVVLLEGRHLGIESHLLLSVSIEPDYKNFPGIGLILPIAGWNAGALTLRGREIRGENGNVYLVSSETEPGITGSTDRDSANRDRFLNAVWSSAADGATGDSVAGKITACDLQIRIPEGVKGTVFPPTTRRLEGVRGDQPTRYQLEMIDLGPGETLTIDTTGGPVIVDMIPRPSYGDESILLRGDAKIVNVRTDGQPPRVGDVRIMIRQNNPVVLYDRACIKDVFLYSFRDEVHLLTSAPGCPGGLNTNFEGVIWAEAVLSSKNDASNRDAPYLGRVSTLHNDPANITPNATSGIAVPDDITSLSDLTKFAKFPKRYRYSTINRWQQVTLK